NALDDEGFDVVDTDDDDAVWSEVRELPYVVWSYMSGTWNLNLTDPGDVENVLVEDVTGDIDFPAGDGFRYLMVVAGTRRNPDVFTFLSGYRTINQILKGDRDFSVLSDAVDSISFDTALET